MLPKVDIVTSQIKPTQVNHVPHPRLSLVLLVQEYTTAKPQVIECG